MNDATNDRSTMTHLSEPELLELLDGDGEAASPHLEACAACRDEVRSLRATLSAFRQAATEMAAAQPLQLRAPARSSARAPRVWLAWGLPLATAAVAVGVALAPAIRHPGVPQAPIQTQSATAPAENDEALLQSINSDLAAPYPPSLQPLASQTSSR